MLKNYFKIAWRNIIKNKVYSSLNIAGLAIGIAASLLILQYVAFEKSYETFHENIDRIYRIDQDRYDNGVLTTQWAAGAFAAGNSFADAIPEIEDYVKVIKDQEGAILQIDNEPVKIDNVFWASDSFFKIFTYPLKYGDPNTALVLAENILISASISQMLYGDENPVGKTLNIDRNSLYKVAGVFEDFPRNTQLQPNIILPFARYLEYRPNANDRWVEDGCLSYVLLNKNADPKMVEAKFPAVVTAAIGDMMEQYKFSAIYKLKPLQSIHLNSNLILEPAPNGNGKTVNLLIGVAFFIMLIAWINYINLATARAIGRAKEVGVRKAVGSQRNQLMTQFFFESGLYNLLAFALAMVIIVLTIPSFNEVSGQDMSYSLFSSANFWLGFSGLFLASLFLSGIYPAMVLSSFKPVEVLKGKLVSTRKGATLRKSLVVIQFAASLFLLSGSYIVYQQIEFMRNQSLGIDIAQTLVIENPIIRDSTFENKKESFKNALLANSGIINVSTTSNVPGTDSGINAGGIRLVSEDASQQKQYRFTRVDHDFIPQFGLNIIAGRAFSRELDTQIDRVIFNRMGAKQLGFDKPEEAIGQRIEFWGAQYDIVGVVENFHQISLKDPFEPMILVLVPGAGGYFAVKSTAANMTATIAHTRTKWTQFFPGNSFDYFFLDENYAKQYTADTRFGKVFSIFTLLAILVACLGLFGLASFTTIQRRKEIGIRKVLGASVPGILKLLFQEYAILLGISFIVAIPFAWWMTHNWLLGYAFRIELQWMFFLTPFIGIVLIALLTVSFQAIKAAIANPVKSLRTE